MPKATDNRPVVGTFQCEDCGTVASLFLAKRGRVKGLLYKRCACGCDQRTGTTIQNQWRAAMTPRPGFEDLKITVPEPKQEPISTENHEHKAEPISQENTVQEPKAEPKPEPIATAKPKGGLWVLLAAGAALLAVTGVRA